MQKITVMIKNLKDKLLICAVLLTAAGAASCSKEAPEAVSAQKVPIKLQGMFGPEKEPAQPGLKAPADGGPVAGDDENTPELTLWFARADETSSGIWGAYASGQLYATRASAAGNIPTALVFPDPKPCYLLGGLKTKLTGWYPGGGGSGGVKGYWDGTAVSWKMDGSQDIMTAPAQEGNPAVGMPALVFTHRTAQLRFYVYAETAATAAIWGDITGIRVMNQPDVCTYTPASGDDLGTVAFSGSATFSALAATVTPTVTADKSTVAQTGNTVLIAPQADHYVLTLEVDSEKYGLVTVTLAGRTYEQAGTYNIYLKLQAVNISPAVDISEWKPIVEKDVEL